MSCEGSNAIAGATGSVASGLGGYLNDIGQIVQGVISPIASFVHSAASIVQGINDTLIKPLTDITLGTYNEVNTLIKEIHGDLSGGIAGLAKLPQDLSNAFSNIDATFSRAVQQLGISNTDIAHSVLAPGFIAAGKAGFDVLNTTLHGALNPNKADVAEFGRVNLTQLKDFASYKAEADQFFAGLENTDGVVGYVIRMVVKLAQYVPILEAFLAPYTEEYRQAVSTDRPTDLLAYGDIVGALKRGILDAGQARSEALKKGLDPSRLQTLIELDEWLPSVRDTLEMLYRRVIDSPTASRAFKDNGLSPDDEKAMREVFLQPVDPTAVTFAEHRAASAAAGFLRASYQSSPPATVVDTYQPNFKDESQAGLDWLNHWRTPNLDWWITAFYKGMRTRTEVELAAAAEGIPPEVIPDLIQVWGGTVSNFILPQIYAAGAINDVEFQQYASYSGNDEKTVQLLLKYAQSLKKAPAAATAANLAAISAANAATMFDDGIIDEPTYIAILMDHNYSAEAATLTVALEKQKQAIAARKQQATDIVNEVNLGFLDQPTAISQLFQLGYTDSEVLTYTKQMSGVKVALTKTPSEADLLKMFKANIIDSATYLQGLTSLGYNATWSQALAILNGVQ